MGSESGSGSGSGVAVKSDGREQLQLIVLVISLLLLLAGAVAAGCVYWQDRRRLAEERAAAVVQSNATDPEPMLQPDGSSRHLPTTTPVKGEGRRAVDPLSPFDKFVVGVASVLGCGGGDHRLILRCVTLRDV